MLVVPGVALVATFVAYPILENARVALFDWDTFGQPTEYVGLDNFRHVLGDALFWNAVKHTAWFAAVTVPVGMTIATIFAIMLNNPRLRGRVLIRTVIFIPVITSTAILGIMMSLLFNPLSGPVNPILERLGLIDQPVDWLGSASTVMWVVIAITIWQGLGVGLVLISAGLQSIPAEIYESASVDGARGIRRHWYVTLPLLRPVLATVALLSVLGAVAVFDLVLTLTNGGPYFASDVVGTYVYRNAFASGFGGTTRIGYAAAASLFMSAIVLVLTLVYLGMRRAIERRDARLAAA